MSKRTNWFITLGFSFILVSAALYFLHFTIFRDSDFIFRYLLAELAFLPISVYLVTIVLNSLLGQREKAVRLKKMNMVIGAYFSNIGIDLLRIIVRHDPGADKIARELQLEEMDLHEYLDAIVSRLDAQHYQLHMEPTSFQELHAFLKQKQDHLLRLLENTNLFEHETFSHLLWANYHLLDELDARKDLLDLSPADYDHLLVDIRRLYELLVHQWADYMQHLSSYYPYLHSFAVRTNPFTPWVSVELN
ncbi:MAG TPA: hypothetical protein GX404_08920 [Syntrophomonadaceae bacterium]|nr:hypothetical protein [Syntrophomonadaceae bacterium]